jgi:hypothetical protein
LPQDHQCGFALAVRGQHRATGAQADMCAAHQCGAMLLRVPRMATKRGTLLASKL